LIVAITTATNPSPVASGVDPDPATTTDPSSVMPEMAFAPDISGVCRFVGIFVMIS
jgi:hypothetical protein